MDNLGLVLMNGRKEGVTILEESQSLRITFFPPVRLSNMALSLLLVGVTDQSQGGSGDLRDGRIEEISRFIEMLPYCLVVCLKKSFFFVAEAHCMF